MRRLALVFILVLAACGGDDDECAGFDGSAPGITVTADTAVLTFAALTSSPNNDCPGGGSAVSLTVEGATGDARLVLCIPNPGSIEDSHPATAHPSSAPEDRVELIDLFFMDGACGVSRMEGAAPTGTATFAGFCDAGGSRYELTLDVEVAGVRRCPTDGGAPVDTATTLVVSGAAVASAPGM